MAEQNGAKANGTNGRKPRKKRGKTADPRARRADGMPVGRPFPPGNNANPRGRPKKADRWADRLGELSEREIEVKRSNGSTVMMSYRDAILEQMLIRASRGDVRAAQLVMEREAGKPLQKVEADVRNAYDMTELAEILEVDEL